MPESKNPSKWTVFTIASLGVFMSTLDGSIVNIALPFIMKDYGINLAEVEWVSMIYLLSISSFLLGFGRLGDIRGRKNVLVAGLVTFTTASLACGASADIIQLIVSRFFQSLGAAMIMATTPAMVVEAFPVTERGKAMGTTGAVVAAGLTAGPAIGGYLISLFSWRTIFYINLPIGIATISAALWHLSEKQEFHEKDSSFDKLGAFFLVLCIGSFLLAVTHGQSWGFVSINFVGLIAISCLAFILFMITEKKTRSPILDLSFFRIRLFTLPLASGFMLFMSLFTMIFLMPFYLTMARGYSPQSAGTMMITPFLFLFILSPISGSLSDRIGSRILCTAGMAIVGISLFLLSILEKDAAKIDIAWRMALSGIGIALFISPNSSTTMTALPPKNRGIAGAIIAVARNLGMVLGIAMAGAVFNVLFHNFTGEGLKNYTPDLAQEFMTAFGITMQTGSAVAFTGMILAWFRGGHEEVRKSFG